MLNLIWQKLLSYGAQYDLGNSKQFLTPETYFHKNTFNFDQSEAPDCSNHSHKTWGNEIRERSPFRVPNFLIISFNRTVQEVATDFGGIREKKKQTREKTMETLCLAANKMWFSTHYAHSNLLPHREIKKRRELYCILAHPDMTQCRAIHTQARSCGKGCRAQNQFPLYPHQDRLLPWTK